MKMSPLTRADAGLLQENENQSASFLRNETCVRGDALVFVSDEVTRDELRTSEDASEIHHHAFTRSKVTHESEASDTD
jgi:hypothetical protein